MSPKVPAVSVIIAAHGPASRLRRCIDALARQTLSPSLFEVIIVDNGVEGAAPNPPAGNFLVTRVAEPRVGPTHARNCGLGRARGAAIAFTDSDCIPDPDWLERGLANIRLLGQIGIAGGKVITFAANRGAPTPAEQYECRFAFDQEGFIRRSKFVATCNMFTTRATFELAGLFDERLTSSSDREWCRRAFRAGAPVVFAADAVIRHPARRTFGELGRKWRRITHGLIRCERVDGSFSWHRSCLHLVGDWPNPYDIGRYVVGLRSGSLRERTRVVTAMFWIKMVRTFETVRASLGASAPPW